VLWLLSILQIPAGTPSGNAGLLTVVALALALAALATLVARQTARPVATLHAGVRVVGVRHRAMRAAYLRQRDPDAAGRPRPRAPSADPAA
jgi:Family of unknown function (DUF6412)